MKIETYDQAIKYLETFIKPVVFEKISKKQAKLKDPLDRTRKLLDLLGNPQDGFKSVLIGGTSGKGSTAYFVSHILKTAGYKTGLTISPHLQKVNERIQVNGIQISDEEFVLFLNKIIPTIEEMKKINDEPSYFEILIAIAFLYFEQKNVDIAIVEVGMGGKYDATNTLNPLIAIITNVSLDHTAILGNTVEKIVREKAGIIKKDQRSKIKDQKFIVITGTKQKSVIRIIEEKCKEVGAKLYRLGEDFNYQIRNESIKGAEFDFYSSSEQCHPGVRLFEEASPLGGATTTIGSRDSIEASSAPRALARLGERRLSRMTNIYLSAIGGYQVENASLAIEVAQNLKKFGFKISEQNIRKALSTSFFPGRFEVLKLDSSVGDSNLLASELIAQSPTSNIHLSRKFKSPPSQKARGTRGTRDTLGTLILDGAHNLAKMKAFLSSLEKIYPSKFKGMDSRFRGNDGGFVKVFIVGFKDDKDVTGMLKEIMKVADEIVVTEFHRTMDVKGHGTMEILNIKDQISLLRQGFVGQAKIKKDTKIYYAQDSKEAIKKAMEIQNDNVENSLIVVTGSLYLVGEVKDLISPVK